MSSALLIRSRPWLAYSRPVLTCLDLILDGMNYEKRRKEFLGLKLILSERVLHRLSIPSLSSYSLQLSACFNWAFERFFLFILKSRWLSCSDSMALGLTKDPIKEPKPSTNRSANPLTSATRVTRSYTVRARLILVSDRVSTTSRNEVSLILG